MNSQKSFGLRELYQVILDRKQGEIPHSETYKWLTKGEERIGRKMVEEAVEVRLASHDAKKHQLVRELCDLLYFMLVLAVFHDIQLSEIENELALRHHRPKPKPDRTTGLSSLEEFSYAWPFTIPQMCSKSGLSLEETEELMTSDVVLFSHNFRKPTLSRVRLTNSFPWAAKDLKNALQAEGYKAKFALPRSATPAFRPARRAQEWIAPLVVVADVAVLPLCVGILAAYLKQAIDAFSSRKPDFEEHVEIDICIHETPLGKESWYKVKGKSKQVVAILESLAKK